MKITIFGSTGNIGLQLVRQALGHGHKITAFVRNPSKLDIKHTNLKVVQGDVMNFSAVKKAIVGQDAVLSALGAGRKGTIRSEGTQVIVRAMEKTGVRRLICLSTLGVGDSWGNLNFFWKYIMFSGLLRKAYKDHVVQEDYVMQSHLDWTIVRPGAYTDGKRTGEYRHGFPGNDKTRPFKISRADVADYMLKQVSNNTYFYMTPGLAY